LLNYGGILNINSSTISGNTGTGIANTYFNEDYDIVGRSTITNSTISGNTGRGISASYTASLQFPTARLPTTGTRV
jgi:hypothetical protein